MGKKQSADVGLRQIKRLLEMSQSDRIAIIAEGAPVVLASAEELSAASHVLESMARPAELLSEMANEEAAKILILLDAVRCPRGIWKARGPSLLRAFYNHHARLIYANACNWRPANLQDLRKYVDEDRKSHFVDGPTGGDFIFPNSSLFWRESKLYADLFYDGDGKLYWTKPKGTFETVGPIRSALALRVARAFSNIGGLTVDGLETIARIWQSTVFDTSQHAQLNDELIDEMLAALDHTTGSEASYVESVRDIRRF